jgi:hypothetical protein
MAWQLIIKSAHGEHVIPLVGNDSDAEAALAEAGAVLDRTGIVLVARPSGFEPRKSRLPRLSSVISCPKADDGESSTDRRVTWGTT